MLLDKPSYIIIVIMLAYFESVLCTRDYESVDMIFARKKDKKYIFSMHSFFFCFFLNISHGIFFFTVQVFSLLFLV